MGAARGRRARGSLCSEREHPLLSLLQSYGEPTHLTRHHGTSREPTLPCAFSIVRSHRSEPGKGR